MVVLSVVVGLGEYVGVRAWALSFTHDESLTYILYVHEPFSSILLSRETHANNHPLNTLAMKLAGGTFGPSEIALRGASVVAFFVYVVALVVLLRRVERRSIRVLGLSLAIANPYVLDFFSLARGYGLALALVFSVANVFFRDFGKVVQTLTQFVTFSVPMIYPFTFVEQRFGAAAEYYLYNPVAVAVLLIQRCFWIGTTSDPAETAATNLPPNLYQLGGIMLGLSIVLLVIAQLWFSKLERRVPERL